MAQLLRLLLRLAGAAAAAGAATVRAQSVESRVAELDGGRVFHAALRDGLAAIVHNNSAILLERVEDLGREPLDAAEFLQTDCSKGINSLYLSAEAWLAASCESSNLIEMWHNPGGLRKSGWNFDGALNVTFLGAASSNDGVKMIGNAMVIRGTTMAVSSTDYDPAGDDRIGIVYMFERVANQWTLTDTLLSPRPAPQLSSFGTSLDMDGTASTLFVGEERNNEQYAGAAYVFARAKPDGPLRRWGLVQTLTATDVPSTDFNQFGHHLAVSEDGQDLIVSARSDNHERDSKESTRAGAVYFFKRTQPWADDRPCWHGTDCWGPSQVVRLSNITAETETFGTEVAMSGNLSVATALRRFDGTGSLVVFRKNDNGAWDLVDDVHSPKKSLTRFVSLSGSSVITVNRAAVEVAIFELPQEWTTLGDGPAVISPPSILAQSWDNSSNTFGDEIATTLSTEECRLRLSRLGPNGDGAACGPCLDGYLGDPTGDYPCRFATITDVQTVESDIFPPVNNTDFHSIAFGDIYGDNLTSAVILVAQNDALFYRNVGNKSQPNFQLVEPPADSNLFNDVYTLAFADFDQDGDLDAVGTKSRVEDESFLVYFRNDGTPTSPKFTRFETFGGENPFGLLNKDTAQVSNVNIQITAVTRSPTATELFAIYSDDSLNVRIEVIQCTNIECTEAHNATADYTFPNSTGYTRISTATFANSFRGELLILFSETGDVIVYDFNPATKTFRNIDAKEAGFSQYSANSRTRVNAADLYGKGTDDLYLISLKAGAKFNRLVFSMRRHSKFTDVSSTKILELHPGLRATTPVLAIADVDDDGDQDMVYAFGAQHLLVVRNEQGGTGRHRFTFEEEFEPLDSATAELASAHGSLDSVAFSSRLMGNDTLVAMITANGTFHMIERQPGATNFILAPQTRNPLAHVPASSYGNVELFDINGDGLDDAVLSLGNGRVAVYMNEGSLDSPKFPATPSQAYTVAKAGEFLHTSIKLTREMNGDGSVVALISAGRRVHLYVMNSTTGIMANEECHECSAKVVADLDLQGLVGLRSIAVPWDFDRDLDEDIVIVGSNGINVWVNTGSDCLAGCVNRGICGNGPVLTEDVAMQVLADLRNVPLGDTVGKCWCRDSFTGDSCEQCKAGRYGPSCEHQCFDFSTTVLLPGEQVYPRYPTVNNCTCIDSFVEHPEEPNRCVCGPGQALVAFADQGKDQTVCQDCPVGSFKDTFSISNCTSCDTVLRSHATSDKPGATSPAMCSCLNTFVKSNGKCVCDKGRYLNMDERCERCPDQRPLTIGVGAENEGQCVTGPGSFVASAATIRSCDDEDFKGKVECKTPGLRTETLPLKIGFWRATNESLDIYKCPKDTYCSQSSTMESNKYCTEHHVGKLCSECESGYALVNGVCEVCTSKTVGRIVAAVLILFGGVFTCGPAVWLIFSVSRYAAGPEASSGEDGAQVHQEQQGHRSGQQHLQERQSTAQSPRSEVPPSGPSSFMVDQEMQREANGEKAGSPAKSEGVGSSELHSDRVRATQKKKRSLAKLLPIPPTALWQTVRICIGYFQVWILHVSSAKLLSGHEFNVTGTVELIANLNILPILTSSAINCLMRVDFYRGLLVKTVTPLVAVGLMGVVVATAYFTTRDTIVFGIARMTSAAVLIGFLVAPSCSNSIFAVFSKQTFVGDNPENVLRADTSIDFDSDESLGFRVYASIMILLYPIGVPLLFALAVWLQTHAGKEVRTHFMRGTGYLSRPYTYRYFESFELLRKILLGSFIAVLAPDYPAISNFLFLVALMFFIVLLMQIRPYRDQIDHVFALTSLLLLFVLGMTTSMTFSLVSSRTPDEAVNIGTAQTVLIVMVAVLEAIAFLVTIALKVRRQRRCPPKTALSEPAAPAATSPRAARAHADEVPVIA